MKSVFGTVRSLRGLLALAATLAFVPLTSGLHPAEAKPPRHAPAYGYRAKQHGKKYGTWKRSSSWRQRQWRSKKRYDRRDHDRDRNHDKWRKR